MRKIQIEWRHLVVDGNTCTRCSETGQALEAVIDKLNPICETNGCRLEFTDTPLDADQIGISNTLLIEGKPMIDWIDQASMGSSNCSSCCEMIGQNVACPTLELPQQSHEAIPPDLIEAAICQAAACC